MAYASRSGRASTNPSSPAAFAVCQRCGIWHNHRDLQWQWQWAGASLTNLRILVCDTCLDEPQQQLRAIALPADPVPVQYALPEPFLYDSTEDQTAPYGAPAGLEPYAAIPSYLNGATYGRELSVTSVLSNGTTTVTVNCSSPHGLATNDQVSVSGLSNNRAAGFFSVTVTTATVFTYTTAQAVASGSLLADHSRIVTVLVGLPRGSTTIYQVG